MKNAKIDESRKMRRKNGNEKGEERKKIVSHMKEDNLIYVSGQAWMKNFSFKLKERIFQLQVTTCLKLKWLEMGLQNFFKLLICSQNPIKIDLRSVVLKVFFSIMYLIQAFDIYQEIQDLL